MESIKRGNILFFKYRVEGLLGAGTFTKVYLARDLQINNLRAMKVLRRDIPSFGKIEYRNLQNRFRLEARLGDPLNHPNLVRVYEFQEDENYLALVMEYCPGGSLKQFIEVKAKGEGFSSTEILKIMAEAAAGLAELHNRGIVHRDLHPKNILLDGQGRIKIADLGLAQMPDEKMEREINSVSPPHPGTTLSMSPEQVGGFPPLTPASDIYSLGLVLEKLLKSLKTSDTKNAPVRRLIQLSKRMLEKEKEKRPQDGATFSVLLEKCKKEPKNWRPFASAEEKNRLEARQAEEKKKLTAALRLAENQTRQAKAEKEKLNAALQKKKEIRKDRPVRGTRDNIKIIFSRFFADPSKVIFGSSAFFIFVIMGFFSLMLIFMDKSGSRFIHKADIGTVTYEFINETTKISSKDGMTLVYVPAGEFEMGSEDGDNDEQPARLVYLDAYWINQTEVTNGMFALCVADGACEKPGGSYYSDIAYADHPVVYVSWNDAATYC